MFFNRVLGKCQIKRFFTTYAIFLVVGCLLSVAATSKATGNEPQIKMVEGMFGQTFKLSKDAYQYPAVKPNVVFYQRPLTIEFWVLLKSGHAYNTIASAGMRDYPGHWEVVVTRWDSGDLGFYMPDYNPSSHYTPRKLDYGKWYYGAVVLEEDHITMYLNAEQVHSVDLTPAKQVDLPEILTDEFQLIFGTETVHNSVTVFDELRISDIVRDVSGIPDGPLSADEHTIGLWHFDEIKEGKFEDSSGNGNHAYIYTPPMVSLNERDRKVYNPGPSPIESAYEQIELKSGKGNHQPGPVEVCLDGTWEMAEAGSEEFRLKQSWPDGFDAKVPGSTHLALAAAGKIPDPYVGKNMEIACQKSFSPYYLKKSFDRPAGKGPFEIVFEGVCSKYAVWLNGELLGEHEGKYIRRSFDITDHLQDKNTVIVRVNAASHKWHYGDWVAVYDPNDIDIGGTNGWHYSRIPVQGIYKSVKVKQVPPVKITSPFVITEDAHKGLLHLLADLESIEPKISGSLVATIAPDNFTGKSYAFSQKIASGDSKTSVHYRFQIPDPQLWWPVDYGKQNLYKLNLSFVPDEDGQVGYQEVVFGIRTVENKPLPGGPYPNRYNWQFVINGEEVFLKGANWCWTESLLGFSKERYERFIGLARDQHCQVLRAWGAGIYETKEFYEVCDRMGVMVLQELISGPYPIWIKTVDQFIRDMRNHPSLIWYSGGNEVAMPFQWFNDVGRMTIELDGTRPFHRTDPWGGSEHNYDTFWSMQPFEASMEMIRKTCFIGEFGFTSMPNIESVMKYLPDDEKDIWPYDPNGSYAYHTPAFNRDAGYGRDMFHIDHFAEDLSRCETMAEHIVASQLAQTMTLRPAVEVARCRWPDSVGVCYYKLTNCVPAGSYDVIDWYGVPKISHYFMQDAYAPLHGCVVFERFNPAGEDVKAQVYMLDDTGALTDSNWTVAVKAYDSNLKLVKKQSYEGKDSITKVKQLGDFTLSAEQTKSTPLLVSVKTFNNKQLVSNTFYWLNYQAKPGCLFELPRTQLEIKSVSRGTEPEEGLPYAVEISNIGDHPAVGVYFDCPEISVKFRSRDSYLWLDSGDTRNVAVSHLENISVSAWNVEKQRIFEK